MATETPNQEQTTEKPARSPEVQAEIDRLAELGRNGDQAPPQEFRPQDQGKPQRPDNVPEKFWDKEKGAINTEALLKSYGELERTRTSPPPANPDADADKAKQGEAEGDDKAGEEAGKEPDEGKAEDTPPALTSAITAAQEDYAKNNGELSQESRDALVAAGIPDAQIDLYLSGVKAQEKAMLATATEAAGGIDVNELLEWAGSGALDEAQVQHLNAGLANPKTLADTVRDLAGRYRTANPGEGRLTNINGGANHGDVYTTNEQYLSDMEKAEKAGDMNARSAAIAKLSRSRKAGTIKAVTPRRGPFGG